MFSTFHGVIVTAAPALAGGLFDHTGDPFTALLFAADRPAAVLHGSVIVCAATRMTGAAPTGRLQEVAAVVDINKGMLSFGSMTLLVGGLALAGLLFWGWKTGQELPLWPALLVAAVNVLGALKLVMEARARQAARQAAKAPQPHRKDKP